MAYTISKTDGSTLVELADGVINTDTGINLIGRNSVSYGDAQNENFVRLLENFADNIPPGQSVGFTPIRGTLWYNTTETKLRVYDGLNWNVVSGVNVSATAPTIGIQAGDQWWDTTDYQLKSWDGSNWQLIGPAYTRSQGKSGTFVESITDSNGTVHTVVNTYVHGALVSITSADSTFTANAGYSGFGSIQSGTNILGNAIVNGTSTNALSLGGSLANAYARTDVATTFNKDVTVKDKVVFNGTTGNANVYYDARSLITQNTTLLGNIEFYVNAPVIGNTKPAWIDGNTATLNTSLFPINQYGVVNSGYLTNQLNVVYANVITANTSMKSYVDHNISSINANIGSVILNTDANLNSAVASLSNSITTLTNNTQSEIALITATEAILQAEINNLYSSVATLASVESPSLVGTVTVNGNIAATEDQVTASANALYEYTDTTTNLIAAQAQSNLLNAVSPLAPINSPTFTGTPRAPTPAIGDNTTKIATTAFVQTAVNKHFNYTVSTSPPTGGSDGDFWFQIST
ncbi:hypothetical protein UFOVP190_54 [uncultured Caudovirales phage]|uniref:Uncharacterized protein n=1 Tax=uncultured Caudovirales phage TaxID=2100421 RepID=A0A6J7WLP9_9CAUD|nr:hypothetical protein UFOVP190_54 [uncultured Caudovirales phage]